MRRYSSILGTDSNMTIQVNDATFNGYKDLKKYLQTMLFSYNIDQQLSENDLTFIITLMHQTEHGQKKLGTGIAKITVEKGERSKNRGFVLYRTNGTKDDCSYIKLIPCTENRQKRNHEEQIFKVLRTLVHKPAKIRGNERHHAGIGFREIVRNFLAENGLTIDMIKLKDSDTLLGAKSIEEEWIKDNFIRYHNEHAKLIEITPEEHLKIHQEMIKESVHDSRSGTDRNKK